MGKKKKSQLYMEEVEVDCILQWSNKIVNSFDRTHCYC